MSNDRGVVTGFSDGMRHERVYVDKDGRRIRIVAELRAETGTTRLALAGIELARHLDRHDNITEP